MRATSNVHAGWPVGQVSYPCSKVWCVSIIRGVVGWERVGTAFPHLLALITLLESPGAA